MFNTKGLCRVLTFSLILCVSATGQEPMTQKQIHQVNNVRKKLAHYNTGTNLDVQLSNGSHQVGTLSQTGPTAFVLVDPASGKPETIDYLEVKRVKASGNGQLARSSGISHPVVDLVLISLAVITIIAVKSM